MLLMQEGVSSIRENSLGKSYAEYKLLLDLVLCLSINTIANMSKVDGDVCREVLQN